MKNQLAPIISADSNQFELYQTVLFDPNEAIYVGRNVKHHHPIMAGDLARYHDWSYISLNGFIPGSPGKTGDNVANWHSFVIEVDPPQERADERFDIMRALIDGGLPFTTAVDSGNKSCHLQIRCNDNFQTLGEWRAMATSLQTAVNALLCPLQLQVDATTLLDATRYTRLGGGLRNDDNIPQQILDIRDRVSRDELISFCRGADQNRMTCYTVISVDTVSTVTPSSLPEPLTTILKDPAFTPKQHGERNSILMKLVQELAKHDIIKSLPLPTLIRGLREQWWPLAKRHCKTQDFEASRNDFYSLWTTWRGIGFNEIVMGYQDQVLPPEIYHLIDPDQEPRLEKVICFVHRLGYYARNELKGMFYLGCRTLAEYIGCDAMTASRDLKYLCECGILQVVGEADFAQRLATEYKLMDPPY